MKRKRSRIYEVSANWRIPPCWRRHHRPGIRRRRNHRGVHQEPDQSVLPGGPDRHRKAAAIARRQSDSVHPTKPDSIPEQTEPGRRRHRQEADAIMFIPVGSKAMVPASRRSMPPEFRSSTSPTDRRGVSSSPSSAPTITDRLGDWRSADEGDQRQGRRHHPRRRRGLADQRRIACVASRPRSREYPSVKLVASQPANYQRLHAMQVTENLMQSNPSSTAC